jgi:hypothetical protein
MYFVANYELTTFVLKMIKKEEKRSFHFKRQMVVSKRVNQREQEGERMIQN